MTRRFWLGLVLALPVFILETGGHVPALGLDRIVPAGVSTWTQCALSTPVVFWAGWPFFQRAWASVMRRSLNMFSLIALGPGTAYVYSLVATFAPGLFPAGFHQMGGAVPAYYEAAAVVTVLVLLGRVLELRAREQTGGAIRALLELAPKTAHRLAAGGEDEPIPLEHVRVGDRLRVRPGDGVPVDGEVLEGSGAVDESMVTGESMPVAKHSGDRLIGGTVNGTDSRVMRAEKIGADTLLARIVTMVSEAQRSRAPIKRLADTVSGYFVPAVLGVSALSFVALAEAAVGIAMRTGTEVAIRSAGITLVKGDLAGIRRAIVLSRATMGAIRQNLVFAFAYNGIGIPIAAGVLYPAFGILLGPVVAALAMSRSSVSVILTALRLRNLKL